MAEGKNKGTGSECCTTWQLKNHHQEAVVVTKSDQGIFFFSCLIVTEKIWDLAGITSRNEISQGNMGKN